jgi:LysM repeat protein
MLIRKIEENNLYYFDRGYTLSEKPVERPSPVKPDSVSSENAVAIISIPVNNGTISIDMHASRVMENNRVQYIIVKDGETVETIEKDFQLLKWELTRYNELNSDFIPFAGQILYLQPKRDKAELGKETHIASEGETMYAISQKYAIKVKKLYEYNRMAEGEEPAAGQKIWLRTMKPVN